MKNEHDWDESSWRRGEDDRMLAAVMESLIEQEAPDSVSAYSIVSKIMKSRATAAPAPQATILADVEDAERCYYGEFGEGSAALYHLHLGVMIGWLKRTRKLQTFIDECERAAAPLAPEPRLEDAVGYNEACGVKASAPESPQPPRSWSFKQPEFADNLCAHGQEGGLDCEACDRADAPSPARQQEAPAANFIQQLPGGFCFAHGRYDSGTQCPKWPACVTDPQPFKEAATGGREQEIAERLSADDLDIAEIEKAYYDQSFENYSAALWHLHLGTALSIIHRRANLYKFTLECKEAELTRVREERDELETILHQWEDSAPTYNPRAGAAESELERLKQALATRVFKCPFCQRLAGRTSDKLPCCALLERKGASLNNADFDAFVEKNRVPRFAAAAALAPQPQAAQEQK